MKSTDKLSNLPCKFSERAKAEINTRLGGRFDLIEQQVRRNLVNHSNLNAETKHLLDVLNGDDVPKGMTIAFLFRYEDDFIQAALNQQTISILDVLDSTRYDDFAIRYTIGMYTGNETKH